MARRKKGADKGMKLNWQQCCERIGCGKSHFYFLVASGAIPAERFGARKGIRVCEADLEKYLKSIKED